MRGWSTHPGPCSQRGRPYEPGGRGSERRFCSSDCRAVFHKAARRWAIAALDRGELTVAELKEACGKPYTLQGAASAPPRLSEAESAPEGPDEEERFV